MEFKNYFEVGEKLEIQTVDAYIDQEKNLVSQLLEIVCEGEYLIAVPIHDGNLIPIPIGSDIWIYYSVDSKGIFYFKAKVTDRIKDAISYLKIKQSNETKTIQRRDYFRIDVNIPVEIYTLDNEFISSGYAKDLSGGGLKFISNKKLELNEELCCKINIEGKESTVKGKVIRSIMYEKDSTQFQMGIKFLELDEKIRNFIVSYIFKQQRILRQKGLI